MEQVVYSIVLFLLYKFMKGAMGFENAVLLTLACMSAKLIVG